MHWPTELTVIVKSQVMRCFSCYHLPYRKYLTHLQSLLWIWYWELLQLARQATNKPTHMDPRTCNSVWLHNVAVAWNFLLSARHQDQSEYPPSFYSVGTRSSLPRSGNRLITDNYLGLRLICTEISPHSLTHIHHMVLKNRDKFSVQMIG